MQIDDAVNLLEHYQKEQKVSDSEASHVMTNLIEMAYYPEMYIIPGGIELGLIGHRYGGVTMFHIFEFLGEVFGGKRAITELSFDTRFPQALQQDNETIGILYSLYMRVWMELRKNGMTYFPYKLGNVGKQGGLYIRVDKEELLFRAGL